MKRRHRGPPDPTALPTPGPTLTRYGRDLTRLALAGSPLVGREDEINEIFEILVRWRHNNALILGKPGVGKTAVLMEIARRLAQDRPGPIGVRGLVEINVRALVAGSSVRGQLEERAAAVVKELMSYRGSLVAVFDDLPAILNGASAGGLDLLRLIAPLLESVETPCIATAGPDAFRHSDVQQHLDAAFQSVMLAEPGPSEAVNILRSLTPEIEAHHGVTVTPAARDHAAYLAHRYLASRALPDSALSLLDQAAAASRLAARRVVETEQVAAVAARWTRLPLQQLLDEEATRLSKLEEILHRRVVGQDEAVRAVANAVRRARTRLADPERPIGSFLFVGPTGVGKTELARALATLLFQSESALVRLDMSEYMERHQIARLIGAPPGYVGYAEGGQLTEAVRQRPYSIILLDEFEKAHADVFNVLLQIMEDGRLTDGRGQTVDFRHAVIIMTSNIGSEHIVQLGAAPEERVQELVIEAVRGLLRPEFLNRIDDIIVFQRLTREEIRQVVEIQVDRLRDRIKEFGMTLALSAGALDWLAARGYDIEYGARPLKRLIQRELTDPLALTLVSDGASPPRARISVDANGDGLSITHASGESSHMVR